MEKRIEGKVRHYVSSAFKIFFFIIFAIAMAFLVSYLVMALWNWLMPDVFGLTTISYWQAFGLLLLAKIFFGFGAGGGPGKHKKRKNGKRQFGPEKCGSFRKDFSEWKLYNDFWEEEGEQAYRTYIKKIQENGEKE
ncbi:MAG: hypothetical protein AAGB24_13275 [Bacteroidota bacterium]